MVVVTQGCKKSSIKFNSQLSLLFSNITESKYENGMPCDIFLKRLNLILRSYIILDKTHSFHRILGDSPENMKKLSVYQKFYHPVNQTKKLAFYTVKLWKPLSILEKTRSLNHYFFIEKNKRPDTGLSKPNYESSLVANVL